MSANPELTAPTSRLAIEPAEVIAQAQTLLSAERGPFEFNQEFMTPCRYVTYSPEPTFRLSATLFPGWNDRARIPCVGLGVTNSDGGLYFRAPTENLAAICARGDIFLYTIMGYFRKQYGVPQILT